MCIIISVCFISCSNNTPSENETLSKNDNEIVTDNNSETSENLNKEKNIEKLYVNYNGFKMDVNFDEADIADLLDAEKNATVPDVKMKMSFAELIAIYDDNTEGIFGTIYMGEDDCYYLQFVNSDIEGAAFKMGDSSITEGLF